MNQELTYEVQQVMPTAAATGFFSATATFQARTGTVSAAGQPDLADWVNVAGLVDLPAQLAPAMPYRPDQGGVIRTPAQFDTLAQFHLLLDGYFPTILQQYTCVIGPQRYELMAVEFDSQKVQTRCAVRRYTL